MIVTAAVALVAVLVALAAIYQINNSSSSISINNSTVTVLNGLALLTIIVIQLFEQRKLKN